MAELIMQEEGSTPATPSNGKWKAYFKSNGFYIIEDTGTEIGPLAQLAAGTYTPTLTNTTNIATSSVGGTFIYMRIGNVVHVAGVVSIDPTAAGNTVLNISIPIASNFANTGQANGVGTAQATNTAGQISSDVANDNVQLTFQATDIANRTWRVQFMYQII